MANSEKLHNNSPEYSAPAPEIEVTTPERPAHAVHEAESTSEHNSPEKVETIRHEALNTAESHEVAKENVAEHTPQPSPERRGPISKKQRDDSFNATLSEIQSQMSPASRAFSKIIHNKAIEKTSEVVGATVARPNAIAAGAFFAFVLTFALYVIAKNLGYPLSGSETIAAFICGWLIGQLYDFFKVMITGKKQ